VAVLLLPTLLLLPHSPLFHCYNCLLSTLYNINEQSHAAYKYNAFNWLMVAFNYEPISEFNNCLNFEQKVEAQEREDEQVGSNHPSTKSKGSVAGKSKKTLQETRPSSKGRRVVPVIDDALRAKYAAAVSAANKRKTKVGFHLSYMFSRILYCSRTKNWIYAVYLHKTRLFPFGRYLPSRHSYIDLSVLVLWLSALPVPLLTPSPLHGNFIHLLYYIIMLCYVVPTNS